MNYPDNLRYTKDHEWIRLEGDEAVIGITDFAQHELGDIVYVEIETVGQELKEGDVFPLEGYSVKILKMGRSLPEVVEIKLLDNNKREEE